MQRGVERHKIRAKKAREEVSSLIVKALASVRANSERVSVASNICRQYTITACTGLCLVPFQLPPEGGGRYEYAPLWRRIIHYFLLSFYASVMIYKLVVTMQLLIFEELNAATFMCAVTLLIFIVSAISAVGTSWNRTEMRGLMISWDSLGRNITESTTGSQFEVLSSVPVCLKLIAITCLALCVALNATALSLVFEDLPVCVFPIIKGLGMIPQNSLPTYWWQISFVPLELVTFLPPVLLTAFNTHTLVVGLEVLRRCAVLTI